MNNMKYNTQIYLTVNRLYSQLALFLPDSTQYKKRETKKKLLLKIYNHKTLQISSTLKSRHRNTEWSKNQYISQCTYYHTLNYFCSTLYKKHSVPKGASQIKIVWRKIYCLNLVIPFINFKKLGNRVPKNLSRVYTLPWQRREWTGEALLGRSRLEPGCSSDMLIMIMIYPIVFLPNRALQY